MHLSRNACWRQIKRLEADAVVQKRVAIIDPFAVGLGLQVFCFGPNQRSQRDMAQGLPKSRLRDARDHLRAAYNR